MASETSRLDQYIVLRKLGKGATAKVKAVEDPNTHQIFAAKIMKNQGEALTSRFREVMQNEMQSLNRINHGNIVNMVTANESGVYTKKNGGGMYECMYIVMELCPNGELFDVLFQTGKLSEPVTRYYFKQILEGLSACHSMGIAHRDLKPENILFDANFNLKIADFGFSIVLAGRDGTGALHTRLGTESYMAPELHQRKAYTGETVDLFATGIILFIMLSQNPPFGKADPNDPYYKLLHTLDQRFWAMHSRGKTPGFYSAEFKALITSMLALEPSRRLSMEQIRAAPWCSGPTASVEEVLQDISKRRERIVQAAILAKERRNAGAGVVHQGGRYYRGDISESDNMTLSFSIQNEEIPIKAYPVQQANTHKYSQILTGLTPKEIMTLLSIELGSKEAECKTSSSSHDINASFVTETGCLKFKSTLFRTPEDLYVVEFTLDEGSHFDMMIFVREIADKIEELQSA